MQQHQFTGLDSNVSESDCAKTPDQERHRKNKTNRPDYFFVLT